MTTETHEALNSLDAAFVPDRPLVGETPLAAARLRESRFRAAIGASAISKAATIGLQLLCLPVAARSLGPSEYGAFLAVWSAIGWLSFTLLGIGPGVTRGVVDAYANSRLSLARAFVSTGTAATIVIVLGLACGGAFAVISSPAAGFFGPSFEPFASAMQTALVVFALCSLVQLGVSTADAAQAGVLEQGITYLWTTAGTVVAGVLVVGVALLAPSLQGLAIAVAVPLAAARVANAGFFYRRHPGLAPSRRAVAPSLARPLIITGVGFVMIQIAGYVTIELTLLATAPGLGPSATASVGIGGQLSKLALGVMSMATVTLWPTLTHAVAGGDWDWAVRAYRKAAAAAVILGAVGLVGFTVAGPVVVPALFGSGVEFAPELALAFGLYFPFLVWDQFNAYSLAGLGSPIPAGSVLAFQAGIALVLALNLSRELGPPGVPLAMCFSSIATSAWILPFLVWRSHHEGTRIAGRSTP